MKPSVDSLNLNLDMTMLRVVLVTIGCIFIGKLLGSETSGWPITDRTHYRYAQSNGSGWTRRYERSNRGFYEENRDSGRFFRSSSDGNIEISKIHGHSHLLKKSIDAFRLDSDRVEIVFLVDASSSVGDENFQSELTFVRKVLSYLIVEQTATRVAVVTYGGKGMITRNIDQITSAEFAGDKCRLLNEELRKINYTGGGTYTKGALLEALTILQKSRENARKVVFLITDGFSNGGDPRPVAEVLKSLEAVILTFGIRTGNVEELHDIASDPGNTHSYFLDSFKEFEALARHALHRDMKEGRYIVLNSKNPCQILCDSLQESVNDKNETTMRTINQTCCDDLAECACGSTSGHYTCLCPIGYYGSGLRGNCHTCPNGTYGKSDKYPGDSLSNCHPCPDPNHIILKTPATSPQDCTCASGFITIGSTCQAITCPKLKVPENGYLVKASACNNVVNAACGLRCRIGFRLVGDSIRLCRKDGNWSGTEAQCLLKTCTALRAPAYGEVECEYDEEYQNPSIIKLNSSAFPIDARCQFKCNQGYQLLGSKVRNCLPVSRWDGLKVTCKQIKCDPLKTISHGIITPSSCLVDRKLSFGTECNVSCSRGFVLQGPAVRRCTGSSGLWSQRHSVNKCIDKTPPVIRCPSNSTWKTVPGKTYSLPSWDAPVVSDNSDEAVQLWTKPHLKFPWKAKIGVQVITYVAEDVSGNRARCRFSVTTIDDESPQVHECTDPPIFISTDPIGADNITWDDPVFHDNSGHHVIITRSHHQMSFFPIGTTRVTYTAKDLSKNTAQCIINITVKNICNEPPILTNGQSNCKESSDGVQCIIICDEGYVFPLESNDNAVDQIVLSCNDQNIWTNDYPPLPSSCSITEIPESVESTGTITLESNATICSHQSILEDLKSKIHQDLSINLPELCSANGLDCHQSHLDVNCTEFFPEVITKKNHKRSLSTRNSKRKRDKIEIKLRFIGKIISEYRQDPQEGIQRLRNEILSLTKSGKLNLLNKRTNREIANLALNMKILFDPDVKEICDQGKVMRKFKCAKCPIGTFHNITRGTCQFCRLSEYQDIPGSTFCKKCPRTMSTRRMHSINRHDCISICKPGYYSKRRYHRDQRMSLEPCKPCGIGFYQSLQGANSCLPCPVNMTTDYLGSTSLYQCKSIESPDPCQPHSCMNNSTCTAEGSEYFCECNLGLTGSRCERIIDPCDSSPCLNEGTCRSLFINHSFSSYSYVCNCVEGFTGINCETYIDECTSSPCENFGICISNENDFHCNCPDAFGGEFCQLSMDLCQPGTCEEGSTCVITNDTWNCICRPGFLGRHCQLVPCDWLPCHPNAICINIEDIRTTRASFRCDCSSGFTGDDCLTRINHCDVVSPCDNSGICINNLSNFTCDCPLGFDGTRCQVKLSSDFLLNFVEPGITDFVLLEGPRDNLFEFTICFWIQSRDTFNYGTVLSYATSAEDNTITLTDYNGLVLYVNGDKVVTDISLNDGYWHFLSVTWRIEGIWSIYVDGVLRDHGEHLSAGIHIPGNGTIVIGQEQDHLEGGFSASESFLGRLTLLDVWETALHEDFIRDMVESCEDYSGTLVPWSSARRKVHGNVRILESQFCHGCTPPTPPIKGFVNVSENGLDALYSCESGYQFYQRYRTQSTITRKCLKQGQWEGSDALICSRVRCGFPGYFPRGRIFGSSYYFGDEIYYSCEDGYELRGNPHRVCNSDGNWTGRPPICIGVTCRNLLAPDNGDIEYIIDEHERDDITILQVGQQLEFKCNPGFKLIGESILLCSDRGQWNHDVPNCEPLGCPSPVLLSHAIINMTNSEKSEEEKFFNFGHVIQVICAPGFVFKEQKEDTNLLKCSTDGNWSGITSDCQPITCTLPSITHGKVQDNVLQGKMTLGGKLSFQCDEGFKKSEEDIVCDDTGNWSMTPECQPFKCPGISIHPIASLFLNKSENSNSTRLAQFTFAIEGDKLGDNFILHCTDKTKNLIVNEIEHENISWRCGKGEQWTLQSTDINDDDMELRRLLLSEDLCDGRCPPPMAPANAILVDGNVTEWRVNVTVSYQCKPGFSLEGIGTVTCTSSGSWSGISLCRPIICPRVPPNVVNADVIDAKLSYSDYVVGDVINYQCHPGYRLFGKNNSECLDSGTWSRVQGQCSRISCGKPKVLGKVILEGNSYLFQDEVRYFCGGGVKQGTIVCLSDGQWSSIPDC